MASGAGGLSLIADLVSGAGGPAVLHPAIAAVQAHIPDSGGDPAPEPTEPDGSRRVAIACNECVRAKMRCSNERPCERCVRRACEHLCVDRPSRVAVIAPTPAVVIQAAAVRRKRPRPVLYRPCNSCSRMNALCDLQRPCGRCVKLNERDSCTDIVNNDAGSETESDDAEILHEVMGAGRPPTPITSTASIVSPIPALPALDPYTKTRTAFTPTLISPRSTPTPGTNVSHHPQQSFVPYNERPASASNGQNRNNRLMRGKPPFMVRSPLQFPLRLAGELRFAYKQYDASLLGPLLMNAARMQHFMSISLDVLSREECIAMRIEMMIAAVEKDSSLSSELIPLCTIPYNPIPFKTRCIALTLDSSMSTHEPSLAIGDDDLLRIAFWESPCAVLRLAMSYEHSDRTEISLSLNTEAQRILGFSSHVELDQLHQDFAKATSCPMSIPLLWRFFSQRSLYVLGMAQFERDIRNLSQFRVDLELVANNGLHVPCRTYWKYRMLPNGQIKDILIAIKRII